MSLRVKFFIKIFYNINKFFNHKWIKYLKHWLKIYTGRRTKMQRYYNLDFLRAFAMMLGLVIHAPIIFYFPGLAKTLGIEKIAPAENWVFVMITFISNWRMPLFFILSGFFTNLVIEKKGTKTLIKDRVIRIGITCVLF